MSLDTDELRALLRDASVDWQRPYLGLTNVGEAWKTGSLAGRRVDAELACAVVKALPTLLDAYGERDRLAADLARERERIADALDPPKRITHGRHCTCSACAREDWTRPELAPCGMHGPSCPPMYDPWGYAGTSVRPVREGDDT